MDFEVVRRIVTEEVLKHLGSARSTVRVRRPVVTEAMIVAARRRGSSTVAATPGAIITPAAVERARNLGISIEHTKLPASRAPEATAVIEAVMAAVITEIGRRPRASARPSSGSRRLVTADDVELMHERHSKSMTLTPGARMTPLANDLALKYGIKIERNGG